MSWAKKDESKRSLVYAVSVLSLLALCLWFGADFSNSSAQIVKKENIKITKQSTESLGGTTIAGTGTGAIPDRGVAGCGSPAGPPLNISFDASAVNGSITDVAVDLNATHSWVGDLEVTLIAPDGTTSHNIFGATGSTTAAGCGDSDLLGGVYAFNDAFAGNWWLEGDTASPMAPGNYRTSSLGDTATGGALTLMNPAFAAANPTGTWTMRIVDEGGGDTGSISAANLTLTTDGAPPEVTQPANVDMDGDGTSDFTVVRDETPMLRDGQGSPLLKAKSYRERSEILRQRQTGGENAVPAGQGSNMTWYISNSDSGNAEIVAFGEPELDFLVPTDYDGDGQADIAVWRGLTDDQPSGNGFFFILNSTDSTVDQIDFGILGDNPTVAGDYDGDGESDPAVFRCPSDEAGQCFYFYQGSDGGGETTFVPWGNGTVFDVFPNAGDFDGDGAYDFCVQTASTGLGAGQAQFTVLRSSDFGVEFIAWGLETDAIAPGDYDGDGRSDYAVVRSNSGQLDWYVLSADASTVVYYGIPFGLSIGDFPTPGDYDGDGSTDISVFRPDFGDPDNNFWYYIRSGDLTVGTFEWGNGGDYPVENWRVN
jgi:subtilisin-like proprotein convertase family protein